MSHEALNPSFRRLIDEHAPVRQLGSGFSFIEGPIWHPAENYLLFLRHAGRYPAPLGSGRRSRRGGPGPTRATA